MSPRLCLLKCTVTSFVGVACRVSMYAWPEERDQKDPETFQQDDDQQQTSRLPPASILMRLFDGGGCSSPLALTRTSMLGNWPATPL